MPEGDVLFRTARTLQRWLAGREVTEATAAATPMVGRTVEKVEANGKHLLIRFDSGHVLHSHMRMTGSWHVYSAGERWQRPRRQARVTLTCGDRMAVCFNAPIVELLMPGGERNHPSLSGLGPDVLVTPLDLEEIRRRSRARPPDTALGELLLDQRVAAGIGNIWRCESLFLERRSPWAAVSTLTDGELDALFSTASRIMSGSLGPSGPQSGVAGPSGPQSGVAGPSGPLSGVAGPSGPLSGVAGPFTGRPARWVYRRTGEGCYRCRTPILARGQGEQSRIVYWCPACQPGTPEGAGEVPVRVTGPE